MMIAIRTKSKFVLCQRRRSGQDNIGCDNEKKAIIATFSPSNGRND